MVNNKKDIRKLDFFFFWKGPQLGPLGPYPPYRFLLGPLGPLGTYSAFGGPCRGLKIPKNSKLLEHIINPMEKMQN